MKNWQLIPLLMILLAGCSNPVSPSASPAPAATVTPVTPTVELTPTNTRTPWPTTTPQPTMTLRPGDPRNPTLTPAVSKKEIVAYRVYGGDGGDFVYYYLSRSMPEMVLYEDGQLIVQRDHSTYEKELSPEEMAAFLERLRKTGMPAIPRDEYFDVYHDPIYQFPPDMQFRDGIGQYDLLIDLDGVEKHFYIDPQYLRYLIPEVRAGYDLIRTYFPQKMQTYRPRQVVLWIEPFDAKHSYVIPAPSQPWSPDLPPIRELGEGHIIVDDRLVPPLLELFDKIPGGRAFTEEGVKYYVILRPLLPNESPSTHWDH